MEQASTDNLKTFRRIFRSPKITDKWNDQEISIHKKFWDYGA